MGAGRPRKVRKKAAHEREDKAGKLRKHGVFMRCSICKSSKHNKKIRPQNKAKTPKKWKKVSQPYLANETLVLHLIVTKIIFMMQGSKSSNNNKKKGSKAPIFENISGTQTRLGT